MNRNVSQTAKFLGVDRQQVKTWAWLFKDYLSSQANPPKGRPRVFTDSDLLVLAHVTTEWEENPDIESIKSDLDRDYQYNGQYRELIYRHTPILQEPPAIWTKPGGTASF